MSAQTTKAAGLALFVYDPGRADKCSGRHVRRRLFGWEEKRARGKIYRYPGILQNVPYVRLKPNVLAVRQGDVPKLKALFREARVPFLYAAVSPSKVRAYNAPYKAWGASKGW